VKRYLAPLVCSVLLLASVDLWKAHAQSANAQAQAHVAAAKAAAYEPGQDFTNIFELCAEPKPGRAAPAEAAAPAGPRKVPPRSQWFTEPGKVFDNVYYVGTALGDNATAWAITTSEGIILIDATWDYSVEELIVNGFKKLGLDPAQIKYVIVAVAKPQIFGGARLLQDRYKAHVLLSEADWNVVEKGNFSQDIKPKKDMIVTDGQKLTLGDVTVTLYVTPGNTPGTVSALVSPIKDGTQKHVAAFYGGRAPFVNGDGVQYFPNEVAAMKIWGEQAKRFKEIAEKAGADVFLASHVGIDKTLDRVNAVQFRKPGGPHPFVSKTAVSRAQTVIYGCMQAQLAWRSGNSSNN
jgi:metallo-beta-lactamase class B